MSQHTARHDPHAQSQDEDLDDPRARPSGPKRRTAGQPAGDGGVGPDEPDENEFELIGDNDLGAADLGPIGPNATDPDAPSGRTRKITP